MLENVERKDQETRLFWKCDISMFAEWKARRCSWCARWILVRCS